MPESIDVNIAAIAAQQATRYLRFSIQFSSLALLYYDYALTWTREVKHFWTRRASLSTFLYFACRYALVANIIYALAIAEKLPVLSCDAGYQVCSSLAAVGRAAILVVWGARTYAIFNRSKWILLLFGTLGCSVVVVSINYDRQLHIPYVTCHGTKGPPARELLGILTVAYELLAFILTTFRSYQSLRFVGPLASQTKTLTYVVLQQGLLYYLFVSAFTVTAVILQFTAPPGSFFQRLLNAHAIPISGMMTARFLLHLRDWDYDRTESGQSMNENLGAEPVWFGKMDYANNPATGWSVIDEFGVDTVQEAEIRTQRRYSYL